MDDVRLDVLRTLAEDTERAVRLFLAGASDNPTEVTEAWQAYRYAVGLRKSMEKWIALRRVDAAHTTGAVKA